VARGGVPRYSPEQRRSVNITEPSWLLLLWAGVAATLAAGLAGAGPGVLIGAHMRTRGFRRHLGRFSLAIALGTLVYPLLYGLVFETTARADLALGAGLGAAHGLLALIWTAIRPIRSSHSPARLQLLLGHLIYGATLGLLYVVP
jgi:hypothetical protein